MTDLEKAARQALEALEKCKAALAEELGAWDIDPPLHHVLESHDLCDPAITALRRALEPKPKQTLHFNTQEVLDRAKENRDKPVTPVTYELIKPGLSDVGADTNIQMPVDAYVLPKGTGKVTIHDKREWVGLTQAQRGALWKVGMTPFEYYQAIEAKLREKNGGKA